MVRITLTLALIGALTAQSAPTPSAPDLTGTWVLEKDASADLTKLDFIPQSGDANGGGGNRTQGRTRRGGLGGFGGGGFGGGFGGSSRQPRSSATPLTKEEKTRAKALA